MEMNEAMVRRYNVLKNQIAEMEKEAAAIREILVEQGTQQIGCYKVEVTKSVMYKMASVKDAETMLPRADLEKLGLIVAVDRVTVKVKEVA